MYKGREIDEPLSLRVGLMPSVDLSSMPRVLVSRCSEFAKRVVSSQ